MKSNVATLLKQKRKEMGWSVKIVREKLSEYGIVVAEKTIYGWESGHRQPDADTFLILCALYGIKSFAEIEESPDPIEPRDEKDMEFIRLFSQLSEEQRRFLVAVMKVLIEQSQGSRPGPPPKAAGTD